ncbi:high mobility group protein B3-like isoform X1 [Poecilia formosa]|uniref:high mobility group protein B3-like isoform X1 n=1 Tax=Poecilia formosa TaxID=48698 RepID=UPI0007B8004A|nr:PREDICTED: high mobility group protein B3-like isoform X1 [Poecilia formosa]
MGLGPAPYMKITNGGVSSGRGLVSVRPSLKVNQPLQSHLQPQTTTRTETQKAQRSGPSPLVSGLLPWYRKRLSFQAAIMMRKDVNKPKGKTSAYAFFVQTCREEHRKKNPEQSVNFAEFSKKCSERWKALSPGEKKRFEDMAKADKVRYNREMRDYVPPKGFGKRGRKRKDPNAPKRPPSAFFVFCSEYRPSVKQQYPGLSIGDCAKKLGEMWSKLSQSEKQPYEEKAQKLREKYDRDMVAYRGGGTFARNPDSSAQGGEEEEDEEGEEDDEDDEDDE